MSRPATDRLKFNAPLGHLPALQYLLPAQLSVDACYQRTLDTAQSKTLIRRIAQHWNWDLCQPLVVARRDDGALYVIDGQHRLEAARLRGDIQQLPAVVVQYSSRADEAASFVHLNQQRQPLSKLDLFKAAVASGDQEATGIVSALADASLSIAATTNYECWKPGMLVNIGGIEQCWRRRGPRVTGAALKAMADGLSGQVLRYAGTLFPGIAAVCEAEMTGPSRPFDEDLRAMFVEMISEVDQTAWRREIMEARAVNENLNYQRASELVFSRAWAELTAELLGEAA